MNLAVVGSRSFKNYRLLEQTLDNIKFDNIVSGGAIGADLLAQKYAMRHMIDILEFKPDWSKYGRSAGAMRNKQIVDSSDELIAFWDNKSAGTKISIDYARRVGKKVTIINF